MSTRRNSGVFNFDNFRGHCFRVEELEKMRPKVNEVLVQGKASIDSAKETLKTMKEFHDE